MTVSAIIASGRSLANAPSTTMYTNDEALRAVNNSWADLYAKLAENNDDFFLTAVGPGSLTLTPVTDWPHTYAWALPATFYRLRLVKFRQGGGQNWNSVAKMSLEDVGNTQNSPGYRIVGQNLWIYDPQYPNQYTVWYYPVPAVLTSAAPDTNLTYPAPVVFDILSYQVAIEIRRKLGLDVTPLQARRDEMVTTMLMAIERDQFKPSPIQNVFVSQSPWR